jgi:hypothetical protein
MLSAILQSELVKSGSTIDIRCTCRVVSEARSMNVTVVSGILVCGMLVVDLLS